jgi:predicted secreted protein
MAGTEGGMGLAVKLTVGTTLTALTYLLDGEIPEFERFVAEATPHSSTGGWAVFVSTGKRKLNEFKVTLGWDSDEATHAAVLTAFDSESAVAMSVVSPDGSDETISFSAFITKIGRMTDQEDAYKCEVSIQPTGKPTIT